MASDILLPNTLWKGCRRQKSFIFFQYIISICANKKTASMQLLAAPCKIGISKDLLEETSRKEVKRVTNNKVGQFLPLQFFLYRIPNIRRADMSNTTFFYPNTNTQYFQRSLNNTQNQCIFFLKKP